MILPLDFKPNPEDILCGRGNVFSNHNGNRDFGRIIRDNLEQYRDATNRPEKIRVVGEILQEILSSGARFAKLDNETKRWYELNDVQAHQKIGHAIRDTIRLLKDKKNNTKLATKQFEIARRRKRSSLLMLRKNVRPSPETRKKTLETILQMSIETSNFLENSWDDSENVPPQCGKVSDHIGEQRENPLTLDNNHERTIEMGSFLLKDEYPEQSFDFSPTSFFGDWSSRITSQ